jgi:predicted PurR-regulated permease PerM
MDIIFAGILCSVFFPIYRKFLQITKARRTISSFLTCAFIIFVILIPVSFFIYQFINEAISMTRLVYTKIQNGDFNPIIESFNNDLIPQISQSLAPIIDVNTLNFDDFNIKQNITEFLAGIAGTLTSQITEFIGSIVFFIFHFFMMMIIMFFFFKDSEVIVERIKLLSPMPTSHNENIMKKFKQISEATLFGIFLTAAIQGFLGGLGFFAVGLPNPIFWGTLMTILALIPFVGTFVVWLPAGLYLIATGNYAAGITLLIWSAGIVSTIDNFLRPYFIHGRVQTYPLLLFLSILGGIPAFGLLGIIIGPLVLTLTFVFIEIYEIEYHGVLHFKDKNPPEDISLLQSLITKLKKRGLKK